MHSYQVNQFNLLPELPINRRLNSLKNAILFQLQDYAHFLTWSAKKRVFCRDYICTSLSKGSMQNMWISVVLIVLVIVIGLIAGARLSTPGPQRRAVYSAFATLAVLALWFFVFVAFFPADWIVPFFTVACIIIPICVYVAVARGSHNKQESEQDAQQDKQKDQKAQKKLASDKSFEIPKKDVSTEKQVKSIKQEAGKIQETPPKTAQATQVKPSKPAQAEKSEKPAQKPTEQKTTRSEASSKARRTKTAHSKTHRKTT